VAADTVTDDPGAARRLSEPDRRGLRLAGWWLASVAAAVAHNGLWATPNIAFLSLISDNLGRNPFNASLRGDYLLTDVTLTTLAHVTGQADPHAFARLHLVVLLVGWAAVTALALRRFGYRTARALTVLLAAAPLVTVSMQWLGQPDPLTGLCGVAMVLVRRRWAVFALAVVAGLTHPEQALFMAAVAGAVRAALPAPASGSVDAATGAPTGPWWRRPGLEMGVAVAGVAVGRLATEAYFRLAGITVRTPRTDYLRYGVDGFARHHTQQPLGLLWTLWGPLWLAMAAVAVVAVLRRRHPATLADTGSSGVRRLGLTMVVLAVLALVPMLVTLDETRVYAVITAPLLAGAAIALGATGPGPARRGAPGRWAAWGAAGLLAVTAVLPGGFATGVTSWRSRLDSPAMAAFLLDGSLPASAHGDLTAWLIGPFDFVIPTLPSH